MEMPIYGQNFNILGQIGGQILNMNATSFMQSMPVELFRCRSMHWCDLKGDEEIERKEKDSERNILW